MLPTPPTMRMLKNYQMTSSMMNNSWRYQQEEPRRMFTLTPPPPPPPPPALYNPFGLRNYDYFDYKKQSW